jgi:hypothetical protein
MQHDVQSGDGGGGGGGGGGSIGVSWLWWAKRDHWYGVSDGGLRAVVSAAWEGIHTTKQTKQVCVSQPNEVCITHRYTLAHKEIYAPKHNHNPNRKQSDCMHGSIHVPFARGLAICSPFGQSASIPHVPGILFFSPAPE